MVTTTVTIVDQLTILQPNNTPNDLFSKFVQRSEKKCGSFLAFHWAICPQGKLDQLGVFRTTMPRNSLTVTTCSQQWYVTVIIRTAISHTIIINS